MNFCKSKEQATAIATTTIKLIFANASTVKDSEPSPLVKEDWHGGLHIMILLKKKMIRARSTTQPEIY